MTNAPTPAGMATCACVNVEFGSYDSYVELFAPDHLTRDDGRGVCVDACLALEITKLWKVGIHTTGCCCGHGRLEPTICVAEDSVIAMEAMGYVRSTLPTAGPAFTAKTGWPLAAQPSAGADGEVVAWRYRRKNGLRGERWTVCEHEPHIRDTHDVQPLYATPVQPDSGGVVEALREAGPAIHNLSRLLEADHLTGDYPIAGMGSVSWDDLRTILAALAPVAADPCASHKAEGIHDDPCCPRCPSPVAAEVGALADIAAERRRQIDGEGYSAARDDLYVVGELGLAAALYALPYDATIFGEKVLKQDDFIALDILLSVGLDWTLKPEPNPRRRLVKAGALIVAEIERLDRAALRTEPTGGDA